MVSTSVLVPLPLYPAFMVQLTVRTQEEEWSGGGEQASEVKEELKWPPSLHWGKGEKGREEREGSSGAQSLPLTPCPYPTPGASCLPHGRWWS